MTILEQLADHARVQVAAAKEKAGLDTLQPSAGRWSGPWAMDRGESASRRP